MNPVLMHSARAARCVASLLLPVFLLIQASGCATNSVERSTNRSHDFVESRIKALPLGNDEQLLAALDDWRAKGCADFVANAPVGSDHFGDDYHATCQYPGELKVLRLFTLGRFSEALDTLTQIPGDQYRQYPTLASIQRKEPDQIPKCGRKASGSITMAFYPGGNAATMTREVFFGVNDSAFSDFPHDDGNHFSFLDYRFDNGQWTNTVDGIDPGLVVYMGLKAKGNWQSAANWLIGGAMECVSSDGTSYRFSINPDKRTAFIIDQFRQLGMTAQAAEAEQFKSAIIDKYVAATKPLYEDYKVHMIQLSDVSIKSAIILENAQKKARELNLSQIYVVTLGLMKDHESSGAKAFVQDGK